MRFCSRYNLQRHRRNKNSEVEKKTSIATETPVGPRAHLGALGAPGAHLGALGAHLGAHLGAPGAHLGALGAHLGAPGAHLGAPGAHLGAPGAYLEAPGAHLGALGAHLGAPGAHLGAHLGAPSPQSNEMPLLPALTTHTNYHGETVSNTVLIHPFTMMVAGPTGNLIKLV